VVPRHLPGTTVDGARTVPVLDAPTRNHQHGWRGEALCAQTDPELFFPEKGGSPAPAKRVCRVCPVRLPCLAFALAGDERHGVWGGLSERERRRVRRRGVVRAASTTPAAPAAPAAGGASRAVAS
jgi:hypothetical protein